MYDVCIFIYKYKYFIIIYFYSFIIIIIIMSTVSGFKADFQERHIKC